MTTDVEIIQGRKDNSANAKILFVESVNAVLKAKKGKGKKTLVFPRDKKRSENPTSLIG